MVFFCSIFLFSTLSLSIIQNRGSIVNNVDPTTQIDPTTGISLRQIIEGSYSWQSTNGNIKTIYICNNIQDNYIYSGIEVDAINAFNNNNNDITFFPIIGRSSNININENGFITKFDGWIFTNGLGINELNYYFIYNKWNDIFMLQINYETYYLTKLSDTVSDKTKCWKPDDSTFSGLGTIARFQSTSQIPWLNGYNSINTYIRSNQQSNDWYACWGYQNINSGLQDINNGYIYGVNGPYGKLSWEDRLMIEVWDDDYDNRCKRGVEFALRTNNGIFNNWRCMNTPTVGYSGLLKQIPLNNQYNAYNSCPQPNYNNINGFGNIPVNNIPPIYTPQQPIIPVNPINNNYNNYNYNIPPINNNNNIHDYNYNNYNNYNNNNIQTVINNVTPINNDRQTTNINTEPNTNIYSNTNIQDTTTIAVTTTTTPAPTTTTTTTTTTQQPKPETRPIIDTTNHQTRQARDINTGITPVINTDTYQVPVTNSNTINDNIRTVRDSSPNANTREINMNRDTITNVDTPQTRDTQNRDTQTRDRQTQNNQQINNVRPVRDTVNTRSRSTPISNDVPIRDTGIRQVSTGTTSNTRIVQQTRNEFPQHPIDRTGRVVEEGGKR